MSWGLYSLGVFFSVFTITKTINKHIFLIKGLCGWAWPKEEVKFVKYPDDILDTKKECTAFTELPMHLSLCSDTLYNSIVRAIRL